MLLEALYIYRCYCVYKRNFINIYIYIYICYCVYHRNSIKNTFDFLKYIYVIKQNSIKQHKATTKQLQLLNNKAIAI